MIVVRSKKLLRFWVEERDETDLERVERFKRIEDPAAAAAATEEASKAPRRVLVAHELEKDEPPPDPDAAVFHCKPMGLELALRWPTGQTATGEGAVRWRAFFLESVRELVVGWENVVDDSDEHAPVEFNPDYLVDGTVHPDITGEVVLHLWRRSSSGRKGQTGKAISAGSQGMRLSSGGTGEVLATAGPAQT